MSNFGGPTDFYTSSHEQSYNFDVPEFGQELNFQSFDNSQQTAPPNFEANYTQNSSQGLSGFYDPNNYTNVGYEQEKPYKPPGSTDFDDEPPLLEELGINPNHIFQKALEHINYGLSAQPKQL